MESDSRSLIRGGEGRYENLRTYHAYALHGVRTTSEVSGVGPVVRVPENVLSVGTKRRLVGYLDTRESCNAGFLSTWRDTRAGGSVATATGTTHGTARSGIRDTAGLATRGHRGGVRGAIELFYSDGRGRRWSCRGSGAERDFSGGSIMVPLVIMWVLSIRQSSNCT